MDTHDQRVVSRAKSLWHDAGEPKGGPESFRDQAEELVAIEENLPLTLKPVEAPGPYGEPIEEVEPDENLGEFPGLLTDQGDERQIPMTLDEFAEASTANGEIEDEEDDEEDEDEEDEDDDEDESEEDDDDLDEDGEGDEDR